MKPSGNIKYTHDFKPFSVELPPAISTESRIKYTWQERDNFTNFDYMHFRFYASSIGRFLTPDNIISDVFNPQSWNLYSYVNGNPVNFNDPVGHTGQGMAKPYYFVNGGSASWLNCNTYCAFMSGLYGGNVTFGAGGVYGGGGTQSTGYWQPIYGTIVTTSGEPVWNEELQAWVGLEVTVTWRVVGYQYVEIKSGGEENETSQWYESRPSKYIDFNLTYGALFGGTGGYIANDEYCYSYKGYAAGYFLGADTSMTFSPNNVVEGWNIGLQINSFIVSGQVGFSFESGEFFAEFGLTLGSSQVVLPGNTGLILTVFKIKKLTH